MKYLSVTLLVLALTATTAPGQEDWLELMRADDLRAEANKTLHEWTTLDAAEIVPSLPPLIGLTSENPSVWNVSLCELHMYLDDRVSARDHDLVITGQGAAGLVFDEASGVAVLHGAIDQVTAERLEQEVRKLRGVDR